jgi:hypothetical protein
MKRDTLSKLERFMRHSLPEKLRNDLRKLRITKEADAECCIYYHLRRTIPANGYWTILARKYARHTGHYIDLILLRKKRPRLAIEIKWNKKAMSTKDRRSLNKALRKMRVNKAYFISIGPDISGSSYVKKTKTESEKRRLHETSVGLDLNSARAKLMIKKWKQQRNLLGKNMRLGRATMKKLWVN